MRCMQPGSEPDAPMTEASASIRRLMAASAEVCVSWALTSSAYWNADCALASLISGT